MLALLRRTRHGSLTLRRAGGRSTTFGVRERRRAARRAARPRRGASTARCCAARWASARRTSKALVRLRRAARARAPRGAEHAGARPLAPRAAPARRAAAGGARAGSSATRRPRSRRQIAAHYDLGNDLFELMLDETMMYSCAIFEIRRGDAPRGAAGQARPHLPQARPRPERPRARDRHRLGRLRDPRRAQLRLPRHDDHDLRRAARARRASACAPPASRTASRCCSRTTATSRARYDKLVSIEMIEAVGWQYFDTFFERCGALLRPRRRDAAAGDHDRRPRLRRREGEAELRQHAHLPRRLPALAGGDLALGRAGDRPAAVHLEDITATTCARCAAGARTSWPSSSGSRSLGYDRRFQRMWELYLAYCEGGFARRRIDNVQLLLAKPQLRRGAAAPRPTAGAGAQLGAARG